MGDLVKLVILEFFPGVFQLNNSKMPRWWRSKNTLINSVIQPDLSFPLLVFWGANPTPMKGYSFSIPGFCGITSLWCESNSGHEPNGNPAEPSWLFFMIIYLSFSLLGERNSLFAQLKMQIGEAKPAGEASARGHAVEINSRNFLLDKSHNKNQDLILTTRSSCQVQSKPASCHFSR